jgi:integrase
MAIIFQGRVFTVMAKHLFSRNGVRYYQRRIPKDVAHHYPKRRRSKIVVPLGKVSLAEAAKKAAELAMQDETLWAAYRGEQHKGEREVRSAALALLDRYSLKPGDQLKSSDQEIDALIDVFREAQIEPDREAYADGDEQAYQRAKPEDYLSPVKMEALKQLFGEERFLASDALELYLAQHDRGKSPKFWKDINLAFSRLYEVVGDLPIASYRRDHVRVLRDWMLKEGNKTTTVRRRLGVIRAVFNTAIRERELAIPNVFENIKIPNLGADAGVRPSFATDELQLVARACRVVDDDIRWVVALLADTGARLAEVLGLKVQDLHIEHKPPYVSFTPNDARGFKTKASVRNVPLVGEALWAAKRVVANAKDMRDYAFPRYAAEGVCKSASASAIISKWLHRISTSKSAHSFRHSMRDRLRNVGAPRDIQDAVGGWSRQSIGEQYGEGYALKILAKWLKKTV